MAATKGQFIKAEGLFKTCEDLLKHSICFERVNMYNLFGNMLNQLNNREAEASTKIEMANKITKF